MTSWGRPGAEKMYKGSSADTAWNHDLLWKHRVSSENKLIGIKKTDNIPVHVQRTKRIDTARSNYVREKLESSRSSRPRTHRTVSSNHMPREILELEQAIRQEISRRQRIEKKLNDLLSVMQDNEQQILPNQTKKGQNTRRVLDRISKAVAAARRTARSRLPQVRSP